MKFIVYLSFLSLFVSCSNSKEFGNDKALFEASEVQMSFKSVADMNDSYFVVKENNFFEFYRQLFDSVKNSSYKGKYIKNGDTLFLQFYNKKGKKLLGNKALIDGNNKEIRFFK